MYTHVYIYIYIYLYVLVLQGINNAKLLHIRIRTYTILYPRFLDHV